MKRAEKTRFLRHSFIAHSCPECSAAFERGSSPDNDTRCMRCLESLQSRWQNERRENKKLDRLMKAAKAGTKTRRTTITR